MSDSPLRDEDEGTIEFVLGWGQALPNRPRLAFSKSVRLAWRQPRNRHEGRGSEGWRSFSADSPGFVGKELAAHCDLDAIAFRVRDSFDIHRKIDGAHDPISELLVDQFLDRLAVD
jgi:hypothetical protein